MLQKRRGPGRRCGYSVVAPDEDVQVFRRARLRVNAYGVAADKELFNVVGVECGQEFLEVFVHRHKELP